MKVVFNYTSLDDALVLLPQLLPIIIPILLLQLVLTVMAIISLLKKKLPIGKIALWLVIVVFVSLFGSVLYFAIGSKMLDEQEDEDKQ